MMKKIILLTMAVNSSFIFGWGNNSLQYNNAALNSAYQAIQQKAINVSTPEVACRAGTEADVAQSFEKEFLADADEDAPISEQRKVQRSMALIRAAHRSKAVSGLTLETSDLHETISLDFQNKEKSLEAEKNGLWGSKLGWGMVVVGGVAGLGITALMAQNRGDKAAAGIVGGVSTCAVTIGGAKFISTIGKEGRLETHIAQVQTMKNAWEDSFKVK